MEDKNIAMARRIAEAVREAGGCVYYVGGFVRDAVMGRSGTDIDLEVHGIMPQQLERILDTLGKSLKIGKSFGIFGLRQYDLDIAIPQTETGESAPMIGTEQAARRRDLTMNALMQNVLTGEIIDYFGGVEDIKRGILRHVNGKTFVQDPLRVLRTARFAAQFGFSVADQTMALVKTLDLNGIASERIWGELEKALLSDKPSIFFRMLRQMEQLSYWFPEVQALIGIEQEPKYHPEGDVWEHTMLVLDKAAELRSRAKEPFWFMLSALCHDFGKPLTTSVIDGRIRALGHEEAGIPLAKTFLRRISAEVKMARYVCNMVQLHMRPNMAWTQGSGDKAMCRLFDQSVCPEDLLLLSEADRLSRTEKLDYSDTRRFLKEKLAFYQTRMQAPYVTGEDLLQAGLQPGPMFREALDYAHKLRLSGVEKQNALKQTLSYLQQKKY